MDPSVSSRIQLISKLQQGNLTEALDVAKDLRDQADISDPLIEEMISVIEERMRQLFHDDDESESFSLSEDESEVTSDEEEEEEVSSEDVNDSMTDEGFQDQSSSNDEI